MNSHSSDSVPLVLLFRGVALLSLLTLASCFSPPLPTVAKPILPPARYAGKNGSTRLILQSGLIPIELDGQPVDTALQRLAARRETLKAAQAHAIFASIDEAMMSHASPAEALTMMVKLPKGPPGQSVEWLLPSGKHTLKLACVNGRNAFGTLKVEAEFNPQVQYGLVWVWPGRDRAAPAEARIKPALDLHRHLCRGGSSHSTGAYYPVATHGNGGVLNHPLVFLAERALTYPQDRTGGWSQPRVVGLNQSTQALAESAQLMAGFLK